MDKVFISLVNSSISASWLILAVMALRLICKRMPKWARCLLWGTVGLRLVLPVRIKSIFSLLPSAATLPEGILLDPSPAIHSGVDIIDRAVNQSFTPSYSTNGLASVNPLQIWCWIGGWVWFLGFILMLGYMIISYARLKRRVRVSLPMGENILQCGAIDTPFILGVIRPHIYIPEALQVQDLIHVLAHERSHIIRKDHLWKPLGFLLLAIYWFNPLIWAAYILLCRDIEIACDEKVIANLSIADRKAYSNALLRCSVRPKLVAACPLAFGEVGVKQRIKSVLRYKKPGFWLALLAVILCLGVAVGFLTDPKEPTEPTQQLDARVLEVQEQQVLVMPFQNLNGRIWVTLPENTDTLRVGNSVRIFYNGGILETFPGQIRETTKIELLPQTGAERYSHVMVDGYLCVGLDIPQGWECEKLTEPGEYGYIFRPEGKNGGIKLYHSTSTKTYVQHLETKELELPSGLTMYSGYEKGDAYWTLATFDAPGNYIAQTVDVASWWNEYEDEVMDILGHAVLGANAVSQKEAIAIARSGLLDDYRFPIASFNTHTGIWLIRFFERAEDAAPKQILMVTAKGELVGADHLGLALSADQISPNGLRLTCTQAGYFYLGQLITGRHFWLEKQTDSGWEMLTPVNNNAAFTTEALLIRNNGTTSWNVNWTDIYGALAPGNYRLGKNVTMIPNDKLTQEEESRDYYVAFTVE